MKNYNYILLTCWLVLICILYFINKIDIGDFLIGMLILSISSIIMQTQEKTK